MHLSLVGAPRLEMSDDRPLHGAGRKRCASGENEERQNERLRLSLGVLYTQHEEDERRRRAIAVARDANRLHDVHAGDHGGRPLPRVEVGREHVLELGALGAEEERVGARAGDRRRSQITEALLLAHVPRGLDAEPVEVVPAESEQVWAVADHRELGASHQLDGDHPLHGREIELDVLNVARQIRDHEDDLVLEAAHEGKHTRVRRVKELDRAASERTEALPERDEALGPPEQRVRVRLLRFDVERLVVVLGVDVDGEDHPLRIRP